MRLSSRQTATLPDQEGEAPPAPQAVHLGQTGRPHPGQLVIGGGQTVLGIVGRPTDEAEELVVQFRGGRGHHLEVGEKTVRRQLIGHLGQQLSFALVLEVVDGRSGHDHIEVAQRSDGSGHVPPSYRHPPVAGEAALSPGNHGRGGVHGHHPDQAGSSVQRQCGQPPVATTEVQQRGGPVGEHRAEHVLAGLSRGQTLDPPQIALDQVLVAPAGRGTGVGMGDRCHPAIVPQRTVGHAPSGFQVLGWRAMELRLDGKTALVTGGSRGIGQAIALALASSGASVMIASRRAEGLMASAATIDAAKGGRSGEVDWRVANAGDPEQARACVEATVDRFGSVDILVNNAVTNPYYGPIIDLDTARADKTVRVNQTGYLAWVQAAWRAGMSATGGVVLNLASIGGLTVEGGIGWYNVTKAAVIHLTSQLAGELGPLVRVNALAPGLVKTDFARALWEPGEKAIASRLPLRRLGLPTDVANAALFLCSDAASWITGHTLVVDGGALCMPGGGLS